MISLAFFSLFSLSNREPKNNIPLSKLSKHLFIPSVISFTLAPKRLTLAQGRYLCGLLESGRFCAGIGGNGALIRLSLRLRAQERLEPAQVRLCGPLHSNSSATALAHERKGAELTCCSAVALRISARAPFALPISSGR